MWLGRGIPRLPCRQERTPAGKVAIRRGRARSHAWKGDWKNRKNNEKRGQSLRIRSSRSSAIQVQTEFNCPSLVTQKQVSDWAPSFFPRGAAYDLSNIGCSPWPEAADDCWAPVTGSLYGQGTSQKRYMWASPHRACHSLPSQRTIRQYTSYTAI